MAKKEPELAPKVQVYKKGNDSQISFCGEPVQVSETGREFFELAADLKPLVDQNSNLVWPEGE